MRDRDKAAVAAAGSLAITATAPQTRQKVEWASPGEKHGKGLITNDPPCLHLTGSFVCHVSAATKPLRRRDPSEVSIGDQSSTGQKPAAFLALAASGMRRMLTRAPLPSPTGRNRPAMEALSSTLSTRWPNQEARTTRKGPGKSLGHH